jgi:hypothetical protein
VDEKKQKEKNSSQLAHIIEWQRQQKQKKAA